MTATACYFRVSTAEQRDRQTIETQRLAVQGLLDREGITAVREYEDDGVSGTIPLHHRPAGKRLLDDAHAGRIMQVIVYRIDRLGRDTADGLQAVRELETLGVSVRSATEPLDTSSPTGRFLLTMLFGFAAFERDAIVQRSMDGSNRLA